MAKRVVEDVSEPVVENRSEPVVEDGPKRVVVDPVFRQRLSFSRTTGTDGREVLRVEIWIDPGGGVTPHLHPSMEERFRVLSGRPSFLTGKSWRAAGPGEEAVVPAGARHAYRNDGEEVAHVVCEARPPSTLQEFLEDAAGLSRAGQLTRRALPRRPSALLQAAVMAHRYGDMVVLGFPPMPPPVVQRLLFPLLARLGERRGHRAGSFARLG